jgi:hypothetical protein
MNPAFLPKRCNFAYRNVKVRRQFDEGVSRPPPERGFPKPQWR